MAFVTAEDVSTQVRRFWNVYCNSAKKGLEEMYSPSAIVFSAYARRSEPAQLTVARRLRESANVKSFTSAELGPMDVQVVGDTAIASYPYHFRFIKANSDGSRLDLDVPYSRGTQILQLDPNGALRIIHEHLSVAEPGKRTLIPRDDPAAKQLIPTAKVPVQPTPAAAANLPFKASDTGVFPAANPIEPDEVRTVIHDCWRAIKDKSKEQVETFYFPTAILFAADSRRSELARLAIARRAREFFGSASSMSADIGTIDVQVVNITAAIASYTFRLHMVRQLPGGKCQEGNVPFCRATTVFRRDESGALRILHEHQSATEVGGAREIPEQKSVLVS